MALFPGESNTFEESDVPMQSRFRLSGLTSSVANVALGLAITASALTDASVASAQTFDFPSSNAPTGNGRFTTTVLTAAEIQSLYDRWRQNFIGQCPNNQLRVVYPENTGPANDTRSEGIGYGMVIAAYMGDQATFEGLRNYYFAHLDGFGLMNWRYNDCNQLGPDGGGSAADADIDAAFGLIVANRQWPGEGYGGDASTLLGSIRGRLFLDQCAGILLAGSNDGIRNCGCVNPSYIPPGYYPAFAQAEPAGAGDWNAARTSSYTYFGQVSNNTTGLVPAWSNSAGGLGLTGCNPIVSGGGAPSEFQADAARTPWRVATDYLWTGNQSAATFLQDIADFAKQQPRIVHIVDRYQLGGAPLPGANQGNNPLNAATLNATERRSSFTMGGFATAMMASSQADLDRFTGAWQSMYLPGDNVGQPRAFGSSLAILYGLLVTGYMWDPTSANNPTFREPPPDTAAVNGNLVTNGDFDEGIQGWSTGNFPIIPDSEGFAMHLGGEVHLLIQRNNTEQPYNLQFFQPVNLQANRNYLMSIRARSAEARQIRMVVAKVDIPYTTYGQLVNRDSATEPLTVGPTMATYETVFLARVADPQARLSVQFGDSTAEVVIDDIVLTPTDRPVSFAGELAGAEPPADPGTVDPTTPGAGGTGGGIGPNPTQPGGTLGPVTPGGTDTPGTPGQPLGDNATGGLPAAPTTAPTTTNGTCTSDASCGAAYKCSLRFTPPLCFDPVTGYVWDVSQNAWTEPPRGVNGCALDQVFWPKFDLCYVPESGYIFNPAVPPAGQWQFYGVDYTQGKQAAADDGGCAVSGVPTGRGSSGWWIVGLLGAALGGLAYRRRA